MQEQEPTQQITFINPITGEPVDELITEKEARTRGYFELEFLLKYLEDDSEFVKYFIINGKKVLVDLAKPTTNYKKKTQINHERIFDTVTFTGGERKTEQTLSQGCGLHDPICENCSS